MTVYDVQKWACYQPLLSGAEARVLFLLIAHMSLETRKCYPSLERLAVMTGTSKPAISRQIQALVKHGLVTILKPGKGQQYLLNVGYEPHAPKADVNHKLTESLTRGESFVNQRLTRTTNELPGNLIGAACVANASADIEPGHPSTTVRANDHQDVTTSANGNPLALPTGAAVARSLGSVEARERGLAELRRLTGARKAS